MNCFFFKINKVDLCLDLNYLYFKAFRQLEKQTLKYNSSICKWVFNKH